MSYKKLLKYNHIIVAYFDGPSRSPKQGQRINRDQFRHEENNPLTKKTKNKEN